MISIYLCGISSQTIVLFKLSMILYIINFGWEEEKKEEEERNRKIGQKSWYM